MASFGHVAVGLLAGRLHGGAAGPPEGRCSWATMSGFVALALLPDADLALVALGAHDGGVLGHRGASHSLSVALAVGVLGALAARRIGWPALRTALACVLAVGSHAFLDVLGHGGRGLPLLWPVSDARFCSPLRIFPNAPRGLNLFSRTGLASVAIEFALFLPVMLGTLWPHRALRLWPWRRGAPALTMITGGAMPAPATIAAPAPAALAARDPSPRPDERDPPLRSSG